MFELLELSLRNFKIHHKLDLAFKPGVTGIIGKNGTGKSAVIKAFEFLVTGDAEKSKEDLITVGEATGYVWGSFMLHGKPCTLERHLDCSKVVLEYDGNKLSKATQVKELWNTLFKVDNHIFRNIIIAHQKQVPVLFSGDQSVREKVFQKIFMVPPCEQIRKTVWDKYITKCPPPLPEENTVELLVKINECAAKLHELRKASDLSLSAVLPRTQVTSIISRISFLRKCSSDALLRPELEKNRTALSDSIQALESQIVELKESVSKIDANWLRESLLKLTVQKSNAAKRKQIESELEKLLESKPDEAAHNTYKTQLTEIGVLVDQDKVTVATTEKSINETQAVINKYSKLTTEAVCPTCNQTLHNVKEHVDSHRTALARMEATLRETKARLTTSLSTQAGLQRKLEQYDAICSKAAFVAKELDRYADATFNQADLDVIYEVTAQYEADQAKLSKADKLVREQQGQLIGVEAAIKHLAVYDGETSITDEVELLTEVLNVNEQHTAELNSLKNEVSKVETTTQIYQQQLEATEKNKQWNAKRNTYLSTLQEIYDVLHPTKFPRKLIQSYSTVVEDELAAQLSKFNLKYTAQIADGFKIEMINENGRVLPEVSGGQEMVVGICLRLALHSLFSSAFPMLIIDEGTTHLDSDNVACYFAFLKELKKETKINQIIIIDHHEGLGNVVDNTINL